MNKIFAQWYGETVGSLANSPINLYNVPAPPGAIHHPPIAAVLLLCEILRNRRNDVDG